MIPSRPRILVLGSGFGAYRLILGLNPQLFEIIMVSPRNHFLFTPLLAGTTVGTIEFRSIIEPMRGVRHGIEIVEARCEKIDPGSKTVTCRQVDTEKSFVLNYNILVIAVGATSNTHGVAGVREYAHFLKEIADARSIRQKILALFAQADTPGVTEEEKRRLLHFVVVGAGPTGVEFAAELHDFWVQDLQALYPHLVGYISISLLEAGNKILDSFDDRLREYTMRSFHKRSINVRINAMVGEIKEHHVVLSDGTTVPYGLVVWSAGIAPVKLIQEIELPKDKAGRVKTDWMLKVKGVDDLYAIGDCAVIEGENFPATAQVAQQEGKYLARALTHLFRGRDVRPFSYKHLGMLAYIGEGRALADLPGVKLKGFMAWLFWRSIYITKLVSNKNKVLVLFDWIKTRIFGRDISRF